MLKSPSASKVIASSVMCPKCGGEVTDTVQRTVGYLRPTSDFTKEKQREAQKVWFNLNLERVG